MTFDQPRPLRQSMSWLHTWSGLLLGWLLFAIFVTGTLSYFRNEITFWMQPELHGAQPVATDQIAFLRALALLGRDAPDAQQWSLTLPTPRNPTLGLSWQAAENRPPAGDVARERPDQSGIRGEGEEGGRRGNRGQGGAPSPDSAAAERSSSDGAIRERPNREGMRGEGEEGGRRGNRGQGGAPSPDSAATERSSSDGAIRERPNRGGMRGEGEEGGRRGGLQREQGEPDSLAAIEDRPPVGDAARERSNSGEARGAQRQQGQGGGGGGHRGPRLVLDPASGSTLEGRPTAGGNFLYRFHFELYGMDRIWARWIVGIATMFMFVALVSGVIVHRRIFKDFFTFRPGKGKRSWLDAHNASSVLSLPFHLIITFSGLVLFGNMLVPSAQQSAYPEGLDAYRAEARRMFVPSDIPKPSGERAPLTDLAALVAVAQNTWNGERVGSITITHPGDRNAVIEMRQMNFPGLTGGRNIPTLRFDGVTGEALATPPMRESSLVQAIGSTLNLLHRGFFATPVPRWLLFLAGIGGSLMIASGLIMWSVSRARKSPGPVPWGHRLVEVTNIAAIAGLIVAIAVHFWANRLIPANLATRADWEIYAFFIAWAIMLLHALLRPGKAAWVEQLACAGALFALLPVVNAATGGLALPGSIGRGLGLLIGFDLCALVSGAGLLFTAYKVHNHVPRARLAAEKPLPGTEPALLPAAMEEAA
ncbi:MAG: PepSY domain-containing protein [Azoarcus sp.]|nr:PepSY domain-containing protein [Azoarcus sp.]